MTDQPAPDCEEAQSFEDLLDRVVRHVASLQESERFRERVLALLSEREAREERDEREQRELAWYHRHSKKHPDPKDLSKIFESSAAPPRHGIRAG